jgi:hypothetical protein
MRNKKLLILILLALSINIVLVLSGCGKKGAPLPPEIKGEGILAPFDLQSDLNTTSITLSWKHETDKNTAIIKPESFDIFMAKKTFKECSDCPFKFNKIGSAAMPSMEFNFELKKGFKYYFRVQAIGEDNIKSPYSNTIQVEFK